MKILRLSEFFEPVFGNLKGKCVVCGVRMENRFGQVCAVEKL